MRYQKPIKGGRKQLPSCVNREIKREVEHIARQFNVSKSFVVNTILAEKLKIRIGEKYYESS